MWLIGSLFLLGILAGLWSGLVGIGGGVIIVPALIFLFGFTQQQAQGTTLALLVPPIGILAALTYYRQGYVDVRAATLICFGFLIGGLIGAKYALELPTKILMRLFGVALLLIAAKMLTAK